MIRKMQNLIRRRKCKLFYFSVFNITGDFNHLSTQTKLALSQDIKTKSIVYFALITVYFIELLLHHQSTHTMISNFNI